jgi:hypothetical protein
MRVSPVHAQSDLPNSAPALTWADSLYCDGLAALKREHWTNAVINFEKLQWLQPGYPGLDIQRERAWKKLKEFRAAENAKLYEGRNKTIFSLGLICLALLAIGGVVVAWPHARAYYRVRRGDDHGAAQIYENIIRNHPKRVRVYPPLADIYLRLGREDDPALKVYKATLRLKLATPNRQKINRIVAQKYLTIDFTDENAIKDDDVIPVLEEALKTVIASGLNRLPSAKGAAIQLIP